MLIILSLILISSGLLAFFVIKASIEKLDTGILPYYPFGVFFPTSGRWTTLFFIIIVALFMTIIFFFARFNLRLMPA
jgi:hypothetical protein